LANNLGGNQYLEVGSPEIVQAFLGKITKPADKLRFGRKSVDPLRLADMLVVCGSSPATFTDKFGIFSQSFQFVQP
jgi:hypothetical protein